MKNYKGGERSFYFFPASTETSFADWSDNEVNKGNDEIVLETRGCFWLAFGQEMPGTMRAPWSHRWRWEKIIFGAVLCCGCAQSAPSGSQRSLEPEICAISQWANASLALCHENEGKGNISVWMRHWKRKSCGCGRWRSGRSRVLSCPSSSSPNSDKFSAIFPKNPFKFHMFRFPVPTSGMSFPGNSFGLSLQGQRNLQGKEIEQ